MFCFSSGWAGGCGPRTRHCYFNEHTTRVLASIQDAEDALAALRAGHIGRIRLGAFPTAGSSLVPGALAAFQSLHPNIALDLIVVEADEAITNLRNGSIDVAVAVQGKSPGDIVDDGLIHRHLLADPFRVVLPRSHPLAAKRSVDLALLASERWIGVTSCPGHCQLAVELASAQAGFRPSVPRSRRTSTRPPRASWPPGSGSHSCPCSRWGRRYIPASPLGGLRALSRLARCGR